MFLLRVRLPDQPGMLGKVATALGRVGADIAAVDVIERTPDGHAIDDIVVEVAGGPMADDLMSACQAVDGVRVIWLSVYDRGGNLGRDLEAVEAMAAAPRRAAELLVEWVPRIFRVDWAMLLRTGPTGDVTVAVTVGGAPDLPSARDLPDGKIPWLPVDKPTVLELPDSWHGLGWPNVSAAAVPVGDPSTVLVAGRGRGPDFLPSEVARIGHLAGLAHTIRHGTSA